MQISNIDEQSKKKRVFLANLDFLMKFSNIVSSERQAAGAER
jgi:hypothetical protein